MDRKEVMDGVKAVKKGKEEQPVPELQAPIAHKVMKKMQKAKTQNKIASKKHEKKEINLNDVTKMVKKVGQKMSTKKV